MTDGLLLIAEITGVHGIKGDVKLRHYGDDKKLLTLRPLCDSDGQTLCTITQLRGDSPALIATIDGLADRTAAEKWRGKKLYIQRHDLPPIKKKNTYYHADLIGLAARHIDGTSLGTVIGVANFGAGDLLDIKPPRGNSFYIPFRDACVPEVSLEERYVLIDPPEGLLP